MFKKRDKKRTHTQLDFGDEAKPDTLLTVGEEVNLGDNPAKRQKVCTASTKEQSELVKKYVEAEVNDITGVHAAPEYTREELPV